MRQAPPTNHAQPPRRPAAIARDRDAPSRRRGGHEPEGESSSGPCPCFPSRWRLADCRRGPASTRSRVELAVSCGASSSLPPPHRPSDYRSATRRLKAQRGRGGSAPSAMNLTARAQPLKNHLLCLSATETCTQGAAPFLTQRLAARPDSAFCLLATRTLAIRGPANPACHRAAAARSSENGYLRRAPLRQSVAMGQGPDRAPPHPTSDSRPQSYLAHQPGRQLRQTAAWSWLQTLRLAPQAEHGKLNTFHFSQPAQADCKPSPGPGGTSDSRGVIFEKFFRGSVKISLINSRNLQRRSQGDSHRLRRA